MGRITNGIVSSVEKKTGNKDGKVWVRYDIVIQGDSRKFGYFPKKEDVIPMIGDIVDAQYEEKGTYVTIKAPISISGSSPNIQKPNQDQRSSEGGYNDIVWKHGPCIIELMKLSRSTGEKLSVLIDEMKSGAHYVAKSKGLTVAKSARKEPDEPTFDPDEIPDSDIPF